MTDATFLVIQREVFNRVMQDQEKRSLSEKAAFLDQIPIFQSINNKKREIAVCKALLPV